MKLASLSRRAAAALLAAAVLCTTALPVFGADEAPAVNDLPKEEVIYGKLAADGSVQSIYAVNHFEASMPSTTLRPLPATPSPTTAITPPFAT